MKYTGCMGVMEAVGFQPPENSVLIAIRDPEMEFPTYLGNWDRIYKDQFWDLENYDGASKGQVDRICDFIYMNSDKNIFAHCEAGISRSGAIATYLTQHGWEWFGDFGQRPIDPNLRILTLLLRFDGRTNS